MKIILTGAAGFVGSNLSKELVKKSHNVVGIDNLSTGLRENCCPARFLNLPGTFRFIEKDITSGDLYKDFDGADVCLHLAARAKVQFSTDFPIESNRANIDGTLNVLEAARKAGLKRVIFSSSSSIYGGTSIKFPTPEDERPMPRSNYALQKLAGEHYCRLFSELYSLDTVCLRYFNICGPGSRLGEAYSALIPVIMNAAVNGGTVNINGDGSIQRDYTPISNVVQANILAAEHPNKLNGECFNIACGQSHTINQVYEKICGLSGKKIPVTYGPARKGDPVKSHADISKARRVLGYEPLVGFEESMETTYNWWESGCPIM